MLSEAASLPVLTEPNESTTELTESSITNPYDMNKKKTDQDRSIQVAHALQDRAESR